MNKVIATSLDKRFKGDELAAKKIVLEALKILKEDSALIEIFLIGNKLMRRLNKEFRGKDKATNILSFVEPETFPHPETKSRYLGEIYLNATAKYKSQAISLLIHGVLHLLGYTHKKRNDRMKMEKMEKYVYHRLRHRNISNKSDSC